MDSDSFPARDSRFSLSFFAFLQQCQTASTYPIRSSVLLDAIANNPKMPPVSLMRGGWVPPPFDTRIENCWNMIENCLAAVWRGDKTYKYEQVYTAIEDYRIAVENLNVFLVARRSERVAAGRVVDKQLHAFCYSLRSRFVDWLKERLARVGAELAGLSGLELVGDYAGQWLRLHSFAKCCSRALKAVDSALQREPAALPVYYLCIREWDTCVLVPLKTRIRTQTTRLLQRSLDDECRNLRGVAIFRTVITSIDEIGDLKTLRVTRSSTDADAFTIAPLPRTTLEWNDPMMNLWITAFITLFWHGLSERLEWGKRRLEEPQVTQAILSCLDAVATRRHEGDLTPYEYTQTYTAFEDYRLALVDLETLLGPAAGTAGAIRSYYYRSLYNLFEEWLKKHSEGVRAELARTEGELMGVYADQWTRYHRFAEHSSRALRAVDETFVMGQRYSEEGSRYSYWPLPVYYLCLLEWNTYHCLGDGGTLEGLGIFRTLVDSIDLKDLRLARSRIDHKTFILVPGQRSACDVSIINSWITIFTTNFANGLTGMEESKLEERVEMVARHVELYRAAAKTLFHLQICHHIRSVNSALLASMSRYKEGSGYWGVCPSKFMELLDRDDRATLAALYTILKEANLKLGNPKFGSAFRTFLLRKGSEAVSLVKRQELERPFQSDTEFQEIMDSVIHEIVNQNSVCFCDNDAPGFLYDAVDRMLSPRTVDVESSERQEDNMILIFTKLGNREAFVTRYTASFIRNFLCSETHTLSDKVNGFTVKLLKSESPDLNLLVEMMSKIKQAKDCHRKFDGTLDKMDTTFPSSFIALSQSCSWSLPTGSSPPSTFTVPPQLKAANKAFEKFYGTEHQARKLSWMWHICHGELTACQIVILLLFNQRDTLYMTDIHAKASLPLSVLEPLLRKFVDVGILQRRGRSFTVNAKFNSSDTTSGTLDLRTSGRVGANGRQSCAKADKKTRESQGLALQAAVVRVMKDLLQTTLIELSTQVVELLRPRFHPEPDSIKSCVERLIKTEYLAWVDEQYIEYLP
ncbi:Cullin family-domain-containing protein [Podospora aff. communis PSN243]|uniref:Cullin family-domain-containing protein n=1 Tax=Podospora aff. communis PSN243 TaxID=3040156 RepID=A0AAV9G6Z1_9PEZI|nr:Cullin family-domain-containing protein [Podospora aff. communis PSN243]